MTDSVRMHLNFGDIGELECEIEYQYEPSDNGDNGQAPTRVVGEITKVQIQVPHTFDMIGITPVVDSGLILQIVQEYVDGCEFAV